MENITAAKLFKATKAFFVVRALVYLVITAIMLVVGILGGLLCIWLFTRNPVAGYITLIFIFGGLFAFLRFAKRYVLYMIKAAHIAAITEYIKTGQAPVVENGYKGVLAYGTETIKNNFGAANVAFAADVLISGATRQIMRWVNKIGNLFSWIPGGKTIMQIVEFVLSTALNFIDEAVLSYLFYNKDKEGNAFKKACDGLVYYAQSWKGMLKGALKVGAFVWVVRVSAYGLFMLVFSLIGGAIFSSGGGTILALILAWVILYGIEGVLVSPYATCIMINDYHKAIAGQPLKADLHGTLCKVSKKFRDLFNKSEQPEPEVPAELAASLNL
ncbi:MAG: hypothetical protein FWD48_09475 [Oscillospiraceae bacterium]|nr:hypothetical protein [Oscillospiraceae bacterium]